MKAIRVEPKYESHEFQDADAFVVEINGVWYKIEHTSSPAFDPREEQDSDNVYKWTSHGIEHRFEIAVCEPSHRELPAVIQQFLDRHLTTGCKEATLMVLDEGDVCRASEKEGWQTKE